MKYDSQILEDNHLKKAWYNAGVKLWNTSIRQSYEIQ